MNRLSALSRIAKRNGMIGFTMVEVLVALLVLSIGLLGLAALQGTGLRFSHQSYQRTQATILIYDIIDRMRANPQGLVNYPLDITTAPPASAKDCVTNSCSAAELANYDLNAWRDSIQKTIGSQRSAIARNGLFYVITIEWRESKFNEGANPSQTQSVTVQI